jgi:hypothetical protein
MKARLVELSSRPGRIFWYSGESYQRLNAALSANSRMTMRLGSGPPSISSVAPARARKRPPYCVIVAPTAPVGLHCFLIGDFEFDDEIGGHGGLPWLIYAGVQLTDLARRGQGFGF